MRILVIAPWTPPTIRPQAILLGKMLPSWQEQGMNVLLASFPTRWEFGGEKISMPHVSISKTLFYKLLSRKFPADEAILKCWTSSLAKRLQNELVDLIFSFANPFWANRVGCQLSKILHIPFIAHFSDPYSGHPYKHRSPEEEAEAKKDEANVVHQASKIVFVSGALNTATMQKYSQFDRMKATVIPHAFSPASYQHRSATWRDTSCFLVSHIGAFYKQRTPAILLKALALFQNKYPEEAKSLRVNFVGADLRYTDYSGDDLRAELSQYNFNFPVDILGSVPYEQSLTHMRDSHLLIAIDKDMARSPFLPSKIIDYIGSRTPVAAFTPQDSPTAEVVRRCGGDVFGYDQTACENFADYVCQMMSAKEQLEIPNEMVAGYSINAQSLQYKKIFQEVLHREP